MTGPSNNYECPTLRGPVPMALEKPAPTVICKRPRPKVEAVECVRDRLDAPPKSIPTRVRVSNDPARHFHLIFTGAMIHPEPVAPPEPDPLALPPLFFRPVRVHDEPLQRTPGAQVERPSFPVPNSSAFVVPV